MLFSFNSSCLLFSVNSPCLLFSLNSPCLLFSLNSPYLLFNLNSLCLLFSLNVHCLLMLSFSFKKHYLRRKKCTSWTYYVVENLKLNKYIGAKSFPHCCVRSKLCLNHVLKKKNYFLINTVIKTSSVTSDIFICKDAKQNMARKFY